MPEQPQSKALTDYLAAVKAGSPEAERLRAVWLEEQKVTLYNLGQGIEIHRETVKKTVWARGEKRSLYKRLQSDYRSCMSWAKEISLMKKSLREEGQEVDTDES